MRIMLFTALLAAGLVSGSNHGYAAASLDALHALEELEQANKVRPWKSGNYERFSNIIGDRVLDETNHVIGSVYDVLLSTNGSIESLHVNFDKLRVASEKIHVNYNMLGGEAVPGGYKFAFKDSELDEIMPVMLAGISTASGNRESILSGKKLLGATVQTDNGRKIGTVNDIIFDSLGHRAHYVLIKSSGGGVAQKEFVVPFSSVQYQVSGTLNTKATLDGSLTEAVQAYLNER